ncbi:hypothetical protein [Rhizobium sp. P007]|uniref:hypothetical protein n=1 Tax=Rhizobium sp. P007 TaxID=285908 RepID=UPI0011596EDD|nr:hypothetical protein [Rhizobium sp. P007]CAD7058565.1 dehydrogenase [Rhizobium sp. P007]
MPKQLALEIPAVETDTQSPAEVDLAVSILTAFDGDALAAIRELLADADFLRDQLFIASSLMSKGIARGWKPSYERNEASA